MAKQQSKKSKRSDQRPARRRYWTSGRLASRKIRNVARNEGISIHEAERKWRAARKRFAGGPDYAGRKLVKSTAEKAGLRKAG